MAQDPWIKVRESLQTDPRVYTIAAHLSEHPAAAAYVFSPSGRDLLGVTPTVTRDVMRDVTVAALLRVWIETRRHASDGVFHPADLSLLDQLAGIHGFGVAMQAGGYAQYDAETKTVTLPNFLEHNGYKKSGSSSKAADRQRRYREKKKAQADQNETETGVTRDVTRYASPSLSLSISDLGSSSVTVLENLKKRINSLLPEWTKAPHWGNEEEHQLLAAARNLVDLPEEDWLLLAWFCRQCLHPSNGMTPRDEVKLTTKRGQFCADLPSILARATKHWKQCGAPRLGSAPAPAAKPVQPELPGDIVSPAEAMKMLRNP